MEKLLIVDDERGIRMVLAGMLEKSGYQVDAVENAQTALDRLSLLEYDLLLVDLQMGEIDGITLIERMKTSHPQVALIILTGYPTINTAIQALREGVDDYLVKPASADAIRAAVRRALDRRQANREQAQALTRISQEVHKLMQKQAVSDPDRAPKSLFHCGQLLLDDSRHLVEWRGRPLALTPIQFRMLFQLALNAGQVLTPQNLASSVQGYDCSPQEAREVIKPHIYALRAALEVDPSRPQVLLNVRGVGYTLHLPEPAG